MNTKIGILAAIAAAQLLLIAVFWFAGDAVQDESEVLLELNGNDVTRLEISDRQQTVDVVRSETGWTVRDTQADEDKITRVLEKLAGLKAAWPVATTSASVERFEVGEGNYQRRVVAYAGDEVVGDLLLGTSPGYQRVHARNVDGSDVYSVELSNYELGTNADDWLDKSILAVDGDVNRVDAIFADEDREDITVEKGQEGWVFNGAAADQDAVQTYANRFGNLRVLGFSSTIATDETVAQGTLSVVGEGNTIEFSLSRIGEDGDYLITSNAVEGVYRLATYSAEQLLMVDAEFDAEFDTESLESGAENAQ